MGFAAPAPSAPPISSNRIYPLLPASSSDALASEQLDQVTPEQLTPIQVTPDQVTPDQVTPDQVTPTYGIVPASRSDFDMQRVRLKVCVCVSLCAVAGSTWNLLTDWCVYVSVCCGRVHLELLN